MRKVKMDNTNFNIINGLEEPINPKENTIWVNSNIDIGEYQFSITQPTTRVRTAFASAHTERTPHCCHHRKWFHQNRIHS